MKCRAMLVALGLAALTYVFGVQAQEPTKPKSGESSAKVKEDLTLREQILAKQFEEFQNALLKLKQRLERSDKQEDKDRAAALERALEECRKTGIATQFDQLVDFLKKQNFSSVADIKRVADQSIKIADDLRTVLDTLREDSRANKLREERERLEKLLKDLEKIIHDQKIVQAVTEANRTDKNDLRTQQNQVTKATDKLAKELGKIGNQGGEAKDTKGQAKEGKGSDKSGQGKDAGKTGDSQKGQGKDAGKGDSKPSEAKGGEQKGGQGSEAKAGNAKEGQGQDGGAKGSKSGSESQAGGAKGNQGQEGKDGSAKDGGKQEKEPGVREKPKAEAKGDQGKEAGQPSDKQGASKSGGQQPKDGGAKGSQSGSESKSGDSKSGGQSGESQQGQAKSGQSSSGQSSSKSGGEQGASKSDPKQPPPQDQPPSADNGKKQIEDANYKQSQAEDNINKGENKPAADNQEDAIKKLEEARKKLEKLLQQTREEELERLLAALQARCEKMLAMQIAVYHGTKDLDKAILAQPDKKPVHENKVKGVKLHDEEKEIVIEADKAIQMLEAEGSAVAFPEVFMQVREDMKHVQRRLFVTDAGVVTQAIEQDIIDTLKEMIDALKKARQELDNKKNPPSPPKEGQKQDPKLLDQIAELKMIRAMQMRVNTRTRTYGEQYVGEQATEPRIRQELRNLSDRQVRIYEVTNRVANPR